MREREGREGGIEEGMEKGIKEELSSEKSQNGKGLFIHMQIEQKVLHRHCVIDTCHSRNVSVSFSCSSSLRHMMGAAQTVRPQSAHAHLFAWLLISSGLGSNSLLACL